MKCLLGFSWLFLNLLSWITFVNIYCNKEGISVLDVWVVLMLLPMHKFIMHMLYVCALCACPDYERLVNLRKVNLVFSLNSQWQWQWLGNKSIKNIKLLLMAIPREYPIDKSRWANRLCWYFSSGDFDNLKRSANCSLTLNKDKIKEHYNQGKLSLAWI